MFALVVRFEVKEGCIDAFDDLVRRTTEAIRSTEDGTLVYASSPVEGSPASRVFIEIYRDRDAFEEHEAQDHTKVFLREREPLLDSVRAEFLTPVDGILPETSKGAPDADR